MKNSAGVTLYSGGGYQDSSPALITQAWNLPVNDCYTFTINDTYGDGIYTTGGYYKIKNSAGTLVLSGQDYTYSQQKIFNVVQLSFLETSEVKQKNVFNVYPNPASNLLNIMKSSDKAKFEIYNTVGQLMKTGRIEKNQVKVSELSEGIYIIKIQDGILSENIKFIKK